MESETLDNAIVVDCDFGDPVAVWQEVVISLLHFTIECKCIITPCTIFEYHVEHTTTNISLFLTIVLKSNYWIVR